MTSLYLETGLTGGMDCFRKRVAWRFAEAFGCASGSSPSSACWGTREPAVESIPA